MFPLKILSVLVALLLMASVRAETNVTIDDTDPSIVYHPSGVWLFQGNTSLTQDRWNKTTHYTSELGATASLTFTNALHVYYIGYGIKEIPPPALVPITLQPQHGSAVTSQSDSYRLAGAQAQIILFASDRLDTTETYTLTVTKTNATLGAGVNIDSFILTQPDGGGITSSPAQTVTSTSAANAKDSKPSPNPAMIAGVLGAVAMGGIMAFLTFRWWLKRHRPKQELVGPDRRHTPLEAPRPAYFAAGPRSPSKRAGSSRQSTMPVVTMPVVTERRHSGPTLIGGPPSPVPLSPVPLSPAPPFLAPPSLALAVTSLAASGRTEMAQVQQGLGYTSPMHGKTRYMGNRNSPPDSVALTLAPTSPQDTEHEGAMLPAYSPPAYSPH